MCPEVADVLVIGDRADLHTREVLDVVTRFGATAMVVDAPRLTDARWRLDDAGLEVDGQVLKFRSARGWLRRYAPSLWGAGQVVGSLESTTQRSFLSMIGSISRLGHLSWLTPLDAMLAAEDRLYQLQEAEAAGARVPRWIVTSDPQVAASTLGEPYVVKPLNGGYWIGPDGPKAVYAEILHRGQFDEIDMRAAPFVAQELIVARDHLRIVTVTDRAWCSSISASDRPLDWRLQEQAHHDWVPAPDLEAEQAAVTVAKRLGVGYTSQDWIRDDHGLVFLDLNPGGQWLFLPEDIAVAITHAIGQFLVEPRGSA